MLNVLSLPAKPALPHPLREATFREPERHPKIVRIA